jgi:hypothetical protein
VLDAVFRRPEHVHQINSDRNLGQTGKGREAPYALPLGVYGKNRVSGPDEITAHPVHGLPRHILGPEHGDAAYCFEKSA